MLDRASLTAGVRGDSKGTRSHRCRSSYCAGINKKVPTIEMSDEDWQRIIDTNLTGAVRTYQVFAKPMLARRSGRLIGIASLSSFVGLHEVSAYTASKSAIAGLTRALAVEWAPQAST